MEKISRNFGLDVVRSMAIILVLISHSHLFYSKNVENLKFLSLFGVLGVEIFFALSGFLIGKIILNSLVENLSLNSLKTFYIRRWFRTLPLYFLVIFLVAIVNHQSIPHRYYVFMQNFSGTALGFVGVSWSLSIEEWFYLLVPAVLFICLKVFGGRIERKKIFFIVTFSIALLSFALRFYTVLKFNPTWDFGVRKQIFLRLDAIMFGVILAGIRKYYNNIYEKITETKLPAIFSLVGFFVIGFVYIGVLGSGSNFDSSSFWKIFLFSLTSFISVFFISWLETSSFINKKLVNYGISQIFSFLSVMSYSIYLIHYNLFIMYSSKQQGAEQHIFTLILTFVIAILLNKFYEIPMMNLRDKIHFREKRKIIAKVNSTN